MSESAQLPDVSDPDIRRMVLSNHTPTETWSMEGKLRSVHCDICYQRWPCPSIVAAREAEPAQPRRLNPSRSRSRVNL